MLRKNHFYFYYRLIKWRVFQDRSPIGASIKITQRCNLRCSHCAWEKKTRDELNFKEWRKIIDCLYKKGITVVAVEGGEPTLHPESSDIVSYIRKKGMYCIFISNGTRDISGIRPDVFWISIDGMQKSHDRIRGKGTFRKVVQTIKANTDRKFFSLTSLSKGNVKDIGQLCEYLSPLLSGIMFNFTYQYSDIKEEALNRNERIAAAERLIQLKEKYPKLLNSVSYLKSVGRKKKVYPWLLKTVTSDGKYIQGCLVRHIEQEDCSMCDMGCCSELSKVYELRPDSVRFWHNNFGLPRLV